MNSVIAEDEGFRDVPEFKKAQLRDRALQLAHDKNPQIDTGNTEAVIEAIKGGMKDAIEEERGLHGTSKSDEKADAEKRAAALKGAPAAGDAGRSAGQGTTESDGGKYDVDTLLEQGISEDTKWPTEHEVIGDTKKAADRFLKEAHAGGG